MNTPSNSSPELSHNRDDRAATVSLHVAEYSALMTRATYLDVFSATAWAMIVAYLTLVANIWSHVSAKSLVIWASVVVIEAMLIVIQNFTGDHYMIVLYIEHDLRRMVCNDLKVPEFWEYQRFLKTHRLASTALWEVGIPVLAAVGIASAGWSGRLTGHGTRTDWVWPSACQHCSLSVGCHEV